MNLSECNLITGEGLEHIKALQKLRYLNLSECNLITDEDLEHIKALLMFRNLRYLNLSNTNYILQIDQTIEHSDHPGRIKQIDIMKVEDSEFRDPLRQTPQRDQDIDFPSNRTDVQQMDLMICF